MTIKIDSPELRNTNSVSGRKTGKAAEAKKDAASTGNSSASTSVRGGDKVNISGAASQMKGIREAMNSTPDIRAERVSAIKADIEAGRYHPDAQDIADAMIREVQKYSA